MSLLFLLMLAMGPRQFFDEDTPGLRYDDEPNNWNEDRQFLDDSVIDECPDELEMAPYPNYDDSDLS